MTTIVKKVLRSSGKKKKNHGPAKGGRVYAPRDPPSPDLRGLKPDEIAILKDVLKRQEEFESEEAGRQQKLRETLFTYEDEVKKHASQKSKLKNVDLRLCRLCYKTKFADGIGKACYDCHKRVCNKCGAFSHSTTNTKKNKIVKGKWRCNMCHMKRDVVAKTGIWYHGNAVPAGTARKIKTKLSASEIDSEDETPLQTTDPTADDSIEKPEVDVSSDESPASSNIKIGSRSTKLCVQRRASQSEMEEVEDEIDTEQFQKERQMCRIQRQSKRSRRRLRSGSTSDWSSRDGYTDNEKKTDISGSDVIARDNSSTDYYQSTDQDRFTHSDRSPERNDRSAHGTTTSCSFKDNRSVHGERAVVRQTTSFEATYMDPNRAQCGGHLAGHSELNCKRERKQSFDWKTSPIRSTVVKSNNDKHQMHLREQPSNERMPTIEIARNQNEDVPSAPSSNDIHGIMHKSNRYNTNQSDDIHLSERERRFSHEMQICSDSRNSTGSEPSRDARVLPDSRVSRESRTSYDSVESSPVSGVRRKHERKNETYYSSASRVLSDNRPYSQQETNHTELWATSSSKFEIQTDIEKRYFAQKLSRSMTKGLTANRRSSNNLSPDMALHRNLRKNSYRHTDKTRAGSVPHIISSDMECSGYHCNVVIRELQNSRLPHCLNIEMHAGDTNTNRIMLANRTGADSCSSPRVHDIIIHRNKDDKSIRTQGLGMRAVGGRRGSDGVLGAYVTKVTEEGPADRQGISEGDQIIEWNGRSLVDVTFEEAQEVMSLPGTIVQLSIIHGAIETGRNQILRPTHPIFIKSETSPSMETIPPDSLILDRPKRRMLPKTPLEIKRDVKKISGRVWIQLDYDANCRCLLVLLLRGEEIVSEACGEHRGPNALVMLHLLPNRNAQEAKESDTKCNCSEPHWNETFIFPNIAKTGLMSMALELTVWNDMEPEDEFLGEVLLDLGEAKIDNSLNCYHLEDHDENSSPLPYRKNSCSLSDSAVSPVTSIDTSSVYPSRDPSPRSSISTTRDATPRKLSLTPAHEKLKDLLMQGKRSPCRDKHELSSSAQSSPLHSPTSAESKMTSSLSSLVRRKIGVVARISSTLASIKRDSDASDVEAAIVRSQSYTDLRDPNVLQPCSSPQQPRRSFEYSPRRFELLAPPHPLNICKDGRHFFDDNDALRSPNPDRPAPEGDDITSLLGPGQMPPRPIYETAVCGDIKMGFMVSKGQLEIDIVVVKGLNKLGLNNPPDTYVKTYLVEGSKTVQKKKTQTIRMSYDPVFRKTIRYSACNIHGRYIRVNVWDKQKTFDKKQCLGEAVVKLDSLTLCQHTMAWYKLFPSGAAEIGSVESLNYWPIH